VAHDYQLKAIVLGLENWACDCVKLGKFLDLRSQVMGTPPFKETDYAPPRMPYPGPAASLKRAADLLDHVADRNADTASMLGATPITPTRPVSPTVKVAPNREETIRLIVHWLATISGIFKSSLRLYGLEPEPIPPAPHPGPKTEALQLAEIAEWILKIGLDADSFARAQKINHDPAKPRYDTSAEGAEIDHSLARIELGLHKLAHDIGAISSRLPYHLLSAVQ
jgi:hypothetical protein